MHVLPRAVAATVVGVLIAACGAGGDGDSTATVRDSAGVTIVENAGDGTVWADRQPWMVPEEPMLDIGTLEGEEAYQLFQVSDALRLSDGRVVVANSGTSELRFFDADGRYLMSAGRKGSGPGEFERLWQVALIGDSIATFDWQLRRVSVFDAGGIFVRSYEFRFPSGSPQAIGPFADGRWLSTTNMVFSTGEMSGVRRDTAAYFVFSADGTEHDSLFSFPSWEYYMEGDERYVVARSLPFSRGPQHAVFADGFWAGVTDRYEIGRYAPDGTLELLLRRAHTHLPVTAEHVAAYRQEVLENLDSDNRRRQFERMLAAMPIPETMPAFSRLLVDADGDLWVAAYEPPGAEATTWTVYDPGGRMRGALTLPANLTVYDIGSDYVLGLWHDELDVPHVRLHRLVKRGA